jgi:hypothetical protein
MSYQNWLPQLNREHLQAQAKTLWY